jgi:hypothetical protein
MDGRELTVLRTKLREVNIEYSGLVRCTKESGTLLRMEELRGQRRALMALIAQELLPHIVPSDGALSLAGSEIEVTPSAGGADGAGAGSVEAALTSASDGNRFCA